MLKLKNSPENFQGGKISLYYEEWASLLRPSFWVLQNVKGVKVEEGDEFDIQDKKRDKIPISYTRGHL